MSSETRTQNEGIIAKMATGATRWSTRWVPDAYVLAIILTVVAGVLALLLTHPYCLLFLKNNPEEIVLTEGEFKAAALYQLGIPAIAIPGISSFGDKHFDRLVEILRESGVKKVTIIFDNEIKDDPAFPNYKEKPADRWDADYWTYMMAYKLGRVEGQVRFITRCGRLPDEWRQNGKIDFDGALALGKTKDDILKVIARGVIAKEFLDWIPDDGRLIVLKKVDKQFSKIPIRREYNKYIAIRGNDNKNSYDETISNFVINIKTSYFTPEGIIRSVEFVNKFGETSATFLLSPGEMAGITEVKKFCLSKGNYIFRGNGSDLSNVWELEFSRNVGNVVYMPETIGYIEEHDIWLFGNMAIKAGKVYEPDSDGIMWIKGKGYKPQSIKQNQYGQESEDSIPALSTRPFDFLDVAKKMRQTVGGYEAYVGIGWAIATIFGKDIFEQYKCTPILFPHGKRESGKSTFARWIMSCFGVDIDGYGISESTQNSIMKSLSYYSNLGCWFDEYRNEPKVIQKDGFFRSAYNRQSSGKGTVTFQTKSFSVNAALLLSGEELPKDNGLFTRLLPLQLSSYKRDRTHFNWLQKNCEKFSYLTYYLITNYDTLKPKIMEAIAELKTELLKTDISDRTAENWAIVAGAFFTVIDQDLDFIKWVGETCQELKQTGENEHMLNQFLEDILSMVSDHELTTEHIYQEKVDDILYYNIWFNDIYAKWAQRFRSRTGREPFDESSIRKYLSDEPYFVKTTGKIKFSDIYKRGVRILSSKAPEAIAEAWQIMQNRIENASYTNYHPH
jgi:DNA primase